MEQEPILAIIIITILTLAGVLSLFCYEKFHWEQSFWKKVCWLSGSLIPWALVGVGLIMVLL